MARWIYHWSKSGIWEKIVTEGIYSHSDLTDPLTTARGKAHLVGGLSGSTCPRNNTLRSTAGGAGKVESPAHRTALGMEEKRLEESCPPT